MEARGVASGRVDEVDRVVVLGVRVRLPLVESNSGCVEMSVMGGFMCFSKECITYKPKWVGGTERISEIICFVHYSIPYLGCSGREK